MIGIESQKMIKVTHPKGGSGGARPLIGGNPPSGPAGAGRVGLSPVGYCWCLLVVFSNLCVFYVINSLLDVFCF